MARLAQHGRRQAADTGDVLIREGERCEMFYIVLSGSVACCVCTALAASSSNSTS